MKIYIVGIIAAIVLAAGAWRMHEAAADARINAALAERDQVWADAFENYNVAMDGRIKDLNEKLAGVDLVADTRLKWLSTQLSETQNALDKARKDNALSGDCNRCRIPVERLQRRPFTTTIVPGPPSGQPEQRGPQSAGDAQAGQLPALTK